MERKLSTSATVHNALASFLDAHVGTAYRDDVGPLFGQAALLCDARVAGSTERRAWREAVNAAVSAEAAPEVPRRSRPIINCALPAKVQARRSAGRKPA